VGVRRAGHRGSSSSSSASASFDPVHNAPQRRRSDPGIAL
jgi:hypothetical protein